MNINNIDISISVNGEGKPFIWTHGLAWNMEFEDKTKLFLWESLTDILKIIRYDVRGHGNSGCSNFQHNYEWKNLSLDMLSVADVLEEKRFIAGGASMGCGITLHAAVTYQERFDALVLAIPSRSWELQINQATENILLADMIEKEGLQAAISYFMGGKLFPDFIGRRNTRLKDMYLENLASMKDHVIVALLRGSAISNLPSREQLKNISIPVLIFAWEGDIVHPICVAKELKNIIQNSRIYIAKNMSQLDEWPNILRKFILNI